MCARNPSCAAHSPRFAQRTRPISLTSYTHGGGEARPACGQGSHLDVGLVGHLQREVALRRLLAPRLRARHEGEHPHQRESRTHIFCRERISTRGELPSVPPRCVWRTVDTHAIRSTTTQPCAKGLREQERDASHRRGGKQCLEGAHRGDEQRNIPTIATTPLHTARTGFVCPVADMHRSHAAPERGPGCGLESGRVRKGQYTLHSLEGSSHTLSKGSLRRNPAIYRLGGVPLVN